MNHNKTYPNWFLWMWEKGFVFFLIGILLFLVFVGGIAFYFDQRIDKVEDRLQFVPPPSYQFPDLKNYAVGDIDIDTLPVRKRVYVPAYSHVYYQGGAPYSLETTLSIRNIDTDLAVYLKSVEYFDTSGNLAKTYLDQAIKLDPLQTIEFLVERRDSTGGSGANFLVEWLGERQANKPLVEAVMVGTAGTQGICFGREGIELSETNGDDEVQ